MIRILFIILIFISTIPAISQDRDIEVNYEWLVELVDSLEALPSLCTSCTVPPEIKSYDAPDGGRRYRLFYSCETNVSTTRFYNESGRVMGVCILRGNQGDDDCDNFTETTAFTFGRNISSVWNCDIGINCAELQRLDLYPPYDIVVTGDPCGEQLKRLSIDSAFESYQWIDPSGITFNSPVIDAKTSGLYHVIVADANGCEDTSSIDIDILSDISPQIIGNQGLCNSEGTKLYIEGYAKHRWSNGDTMASTIFYQPGLTTVEVYNQEGCQEVAQMTLLDKRNQSVELTPSAPDIYINQNIQMSLKASNYAQGEIQRITWTVNGHEMDEDSPLLDVRIKEYSQIEVEVTSIYGCIQKYDMAIDPLEANRVFYAPNIINPNSINGNDRFYLQGLDGTIFIREITIYNRWGVPVYVGERLSLNDYDKGWKGNMHNQMAPAGTYLYNAELVYADSKTEYVRGTITLVY